MKILAALLLTAGPATAGALVVIESTAPSLPPGTATPEETPVILRAGERVAVIDAEGVTRTGVGPCAGPLSGCVAKDDGEWLRRGRPVAPEERRGVPLAPELRPEPAPGDPSPIDG